MEKYISHRTDIDEIIAMLKKALRHEFIGLHAYFNAYYDIHGIEAHSISEEIEEIMCDEKKHCHKLATRLKELDSDVDCEWENMEEKPKQLSMNSCDLLESLKEDEEELMDIYHKLLLYTENNDHTTHFMVNRIMEDEQRHYSILDSFVKDIKYIKNKI